MEELFAKPVVGAIIESRQGGARRILLQRRQKTGGGADNGLLARSDEAEGFQWVALDQLRGLLRDESQFYAMHLLALRRYLERTQ